MALLDELFGGTPPTPEDMQVLVQRLAQLQQQPQMGSQGITVSNPETLDAVEQFRRRAQATQMQGDGVVEAQRLNQGIQERAAANRATEARAATRASASPQSGPSGLEQLGAFLAGGSQGDGLLSAIGHGIGNVSAKNKAAETDNMTMKALVSKGLDPETAQLAVRNPAIMKEMMTLFSRDPPKTIDLPGAFGQTQSLYWDPATKKYKPMAGVVDGSRPTGTQMAAQAAVAASEGVPANQATSTAQTGTVPSAAPAKAVAPNLSTDGNHVIGNAVAKAPEGYVHKLAENGSGYLYTQDGRPVFEPKAEVEARSRIGEKRADERREAERSLGSVKDVIQSARNAADKPGFEGGLNLGRSKLNVGINTPFGMLGGDVTTPVKQVARWSDPNNPAWAAHDEIMQQKRALELRATQMFMKGQGAVTENERKLVEEAIGQLEMSSNAADYQFRLNRVERLMEAMNNPMPGAVTAADKDKGGTSPSEAEIYSLINNDGTYSTEKAHAMAKRFNVKPAEFDKYVQEIFRRRDPQPQATGGRF